MLVGAGENGRVSLSPKNMMMITHILLVVLVGSALVDCRPNQDTYATTLEISEPTSSNVDATIPEISEPTSSYVDVAAVEKVFDTGLKLTDSIVSGTSGSVDLLTLQESSKNLVKNSRDFAVNSIKSFNKLSKLSEGEVKGVELLGPAFDVVKNFTGSTVGFVKGVSGPSGELLKEFLSLSRSVLNNIAPLLQELPPPPEIKIPDFSQLQIPVVKIPDVSFSTNFSFPNIQIPEVQIPDVQIPKVDFPNVILPDVSVPEVKIPSVTLVKSYVDVPIIKVETSQPSSSYRRGKKYSSRETSRGRRGY